MTLTLFMEIHSIECPQKQNEAKEDVFERT